MIGTVVVASSTSSYYISKHPVSGRSFGLGNAFTAIAEGESSIVMNPAGLAYPGAGYSFQMLDVDEVSYSRYQGHFY